MKLFERIWRRGRSLMELTHGVRGLFISIYKIYCIYSCEVEWNISSIEGKYWMKIFVEGGDTHTYTYNLDYTTREACIIRFHWLFVISNFCHCQNAWYRLCHLSKFLTVRLEIMKSYMFKCHGIRYLRFY